MTDPAQAADAPPRVLSRRELNRSLLARQMLLVRARMPIEPAVRHLVGLQAQRPDPPHIGLWSRLFGIRHTDIDDLIDRRRLLRVAAMRATIHLLTVDDALGLRPVIQPALDRELSAPVFMQLAKGSWGFQAGVEQVDLVLLVMNDQGVQKLLENTVNLGADASVAAGPIGRRGGVGADAPVTAEILSYSKSKGLFAGIDVSGGVLRPDVDVNTGVYGHGATPRTILASREISAPPAAAPFLNALKAAGSSTAAAPDRGAASAARPASSGSATSRPSTISTADDDLRARVVDIQHMLDRMLADTTPAPVGTAGAVGATPAANTVTVDRTRLLQLRERLEALLATLDRR